MPPIEASTERLPGGGAPGPGIGPAAPIPVAAPADLVVAGVTDPWSGDVGGYAVWGDRMWRIPEPADVEASICVDAGGRVAVPGLVDLHTHVYRGVTPWGIDPDAHAPRSGVTTLVDAGSAGASTVDGLAAQLAGARTVTALALLNLSRIGLVGEYDELASTSLIDVDAAASAIAARPELLVGVKARLNSDTVGSLAAVALDAAIELRDRVGLPLMVDIYDPPPPVDDILARVGPGDLLTHCFVPAGNRLAANPGRIAAVIDAKARGVLLDVGHGMGSFSYDEAEALLSAGVEPDTISSDLHTGCVHGPAYDLLTVMSKLVAVGLPVSSALDAVTFTPRAALGDHHARVRWEIGDDLPADLAVLASDEVCSLEDVRGTQRQAARFECSLTISRGAITHLHPRLDTRRRHHYQGRDNESG